MKIGEISKNEWNEMVMGERVEKNLNEMLYEFEMQTDEEREEFEKEINDLLENGICPICEKYIGDDVKEHKEECIDKHLKMIGLRR